MADEEGEAPRSNFDSLHFSFITVFQLITGENWNEVMKTGVTRVGWWTVVYFVMVYVLGNFMVLNLFLATLMESFSSYAGSTRALSSDGSSRSLLDRVTAAVAEPGATSSMAQNSKHGTISSKIGGLGNVDEARYRQSDSRPAGSEANSFSRYSSRMAKTRLDLDRTTTTKDILNRLGSNNLMTKHMSGQSHRMLVREKATRTVTTVSRTTRLKRYLRVQWGFFTSREYSLFLLSPSNAFRIMMARTVASKAFERVIFSFILASCAVLAVKNTDDNDMLYAFNLCITIIFVVEALMKITALGFILHPTSYLRADWFNVLDFTIVIIDVSFFWATDITYIKVIRILRVLRSLRLISSLKGMRITITSIFRAIPGILNVVVMLALFMLLFGLLGVQFFKGQLYRCNDGSLVDEVDCTGTFDDPYIDGLTLPRQWSNPSQHFDNIGAGMLTLFEVSTLENWPHIMFLSVDASPHSEAPDRDAHPEASLFYVVYIVLVNFFVLNMFIGVVYMEFQKVKKSKENTLFLSEEQRYWIDLQREILYTSPPKVPSAPQNRGRYALFQLATHPYFEPTMNIFIVLNVILFSMNYEDQPHDYNEALTYLDYMFTFIFVIEAAIKLLGFGVRQYFSSKWNTFDFVIVSTTFARFMVEVTAGSKSVNVSFLRVFRVFRIFRFAKNFRTLKRLFQTLILSLYSLVNIGILLLILFFIFAVLGMNFFEGIRHGQFLDEHANFDSFFNAVLTLYRMLSGENWNGIMHDCSVQEPYCTKGIDCGSTWAPLYFVAFVVLGKFVVLNLFITVILEQFSSIGKADKFHVSSEDIKLYARAWAAFMPDGGVDMPAELVPTLLLEIPEPLGLKPSFGDVGTCVTRGDVLRKMKPLNVMLRDGRVHYHELLNELSRHALGPKARITQDCAPIRDHQRNLAKVYPELLDEGMAPLDTNDEGEPFFLVQSYAAILIQAQWRGKRTQRAMETNRDRSHADMSVEDLSASSSPGEYLNRPLKRPVGNLAPKESPSDDDFLASPPATRRSMSDPQRATVLVVPPSGPRPEVRGRDQVSGLNDSLPVSNSEAVPKRTLLFIDTARPKDGEDIGDLVQSARGPGERPRRLTRHKEAPSLHLGVHKTLKGSHSASIGERITLVTSTNKRLHILSPAARKRWLEHDLNL